VGTAGRPEGLGRKKGKWKEKDVFILIVTTRRLLGRACHNTGSVPRHFSPFPVQLAPSPRIAAPPYTIVDHDPLDSPTAPTGVSLSPRSSPSPFFSRSQVHSHLISDGSTDPPHARYPNVTNHIISDLKIFPSLSWISPHFLPHLTFTHLTSPHLVLSLFRPPCIQLDAAPDTLKVLMCLSSDGCRPSHALYLLRSTGPSTSCLLQL